MFGSTKYLEEAFLKHIEKDESVLKKLVDTLDDIKDAIHDINIQVTDNHANSKLGLVQVKSDILGTVFNRAVDKTTYESDIKEIKILVEKIEASYKTGLDRKVDRRELTMIWAIVSTLVGGFAWLLTYK